jgi:RecA-family ATPase
MTIPSELRDLKRWCNWKLKPKADGLGYTKPPIQPNGQGAEADNPETWSTFEEVWVGQHPKVGFFIEEPYCGIDFDECVDLDTMRINPVVKAWLEKFGTYAEYSPSCFNNTKTKGGVKVIGRGRLPAPAPNSGPKNKLSNIEIYDTHRYFTVTDCHIEGTPLVVNEIPCLAEFYHSRKPTNERLKPRAKQTLVEVSQSSLVKISHQEKMVHLGQGAWKEMGYESQSSGDQSYVNHLCRLCQGNPAKIDSMFRASGLMREKWDEQRGEKTYGQITIDTALAGYKGPRKFFLKSRRASEIQGSVTGWIWPGKFPLGKHIHGYGAGGVGKSTVITDICARASTGRDWPDGQKNVFEPCEVAVVTFSEDTYSDIVVPSLMVHEADLTKWHCIDGLMTEESDEEIGFSLDNLPELEEYVADNPAIKIVIINPLSAGFGSGKMIDQQDVRAHFNKLNQFADRKQLTPISIGHDKKGIESNAANKASGSAQITNGVRAAFYFMKGRGDEPCSMVPAKENLSREKGLQYEIIKVDHPLGKDKDPHNIGFPKAQWLGKQEKSADQLLEESTDKDESKAFSCRQFIKEQLKSGPKHQKLFVEYAKSLNGSDEANQKAMQRAKAKLNVASSREGMWSLPDVAQAEVSGDLGF